MLGITAYLPSWNNGFISDDFVILDGADPFGTSVTQPFRFDSAQYFRLTTYAVFAAVKYAVGYHSWILYAFSTALHIANALITFLILKRLTSPATAALIAAMFSVVFYGDEAVMWLAGMNESLMTFGVLGSLMRRNYALSAFFYIFALLSKETAPILLAFVAAFEWSRSQGKYAFESRYLYMVLPTIVFATAFGLLAGSNSIVESGRFSLTLDFLVVFARSLHRIFFPWCTS